MDRLALCEARTLPSIIIIRVRLSIRRDLAPPGQPDHERLAYSAALGITGIFGRFQRPLPAHHGLIRNRTSTGATGAAPSLGHAYRQFLLCNYPNGRENDAVRNVKQNRNASVERFREGDGVMAPTSNDACAKRAMRRPVSRPIMEPAVGRVDGCADQSVPPREGRGQSFHHQSLEMFP